MSQAAHHQFGPRIELPNFPHVLAALSGTELVEGHFARPYLRTGPRSGQMQEDEVIVTTLGDALANTSGAQRDALQWFSDNAGKVVPWPGQLASGIFLANKAKGIHKPAGWDHALSIRQSLSGPYQDREVSPRSDGGWSFDYFQEGKDPSRRDDDFTNRALVRNMDDGIPIGVLIQEKAKPNPRYRVLGLARVVSWAGGYFRLEGYSPAGEINLVESQSDVLTAALSTEPVSMTDARKRINAAIVARQGAGKFRKAALEAFGGQCAITGCDVVEVLEAAHIVPYLGPNTNVITNTLLLRADVHTLFDRGLLSIDPVSLKVNVMPALQDSVYGSFQGQAVSLPHGDSPTWKANFKIRHGMALT